MHLARGKGELGVAPTVSHTNGGAFTRRTRAAVPVPDAGWQCPGLRFWSSELSAVKKVLQKHQSASRTADFLSFSFLSTFISEVMALKMHVTL